MILDDKEVDAVLAHPLLKYIYVDDPNYQSVVTSIEAGIVSLDEVFRILSLANRIRRKFAYFDHCLLWDLLNSITLESNTTGRTISCVIADYFDTLHAIRQQDMDSFLAFKQRWQLKLGSEES